MFIPVPTQKKPDGLVEFEVGKKERKNAGVNNTIHLNRWINPSEIGERDQSTAPVKSPHYRNADGLS